jgi:adenosylcobinamide-phosphate synthase
VQVRESAIESLAENLNDSVVAPLFWFALLGLPGAALYRFANTADAMWGYPGMRGGRYWQWAGKWAARADDVLSWLPARITALLLAVVPAACRCHAGAPGAQDPIAQQRLAHGGHGAGVGCAAGQAGCVHSCTARAAGPGPLHTRRAARLGTQVVLALVPVVAAWQLLVLVGVAWAHA